MGYSHIMEDCKPWERKNCYMLRKYHSYTHNVAPKKPDTERYILCD